MIEEWFLVYLTSTSTKAFSPSEPRVGNIPRTLTCDPTIIHWFLLFFDAVDCLTIKIAWRHHLCNTIVKMRLKTLFSCSNFVASSSLFTSTAKDGVFERSQSTNESFSRPLVLSFFYHSQYHIFYVLAQTSFGKLTKKVFFLLNTLSVDASGTTCFVPFQ